MTEADGIIGAVEYMAAAFKAAGLTVPTIRLVSHEELRRLASIVERDKGALMRLREPPEVLTACTLSGVRIEAPG